MLIKEPIYKRFLEKTLQRSKAAAYFSAIYPSRSISQSLSNILIPKPPIYYWNYLLKRDGNFNLSKYALNGVNVIKIANDYYNPVIEDDDYELIPQFNNDNSNNNTSEDNLSGSYTENLTNDIIEKFKKYWYIFAIGFTGIIYIFKRKK